MNNNSSFVGDDDNDAPAANNENIDDQAQCAKLQQKVIRFMQKSQQAGVSILDNLHSQKEFHNPELLQKMVQNQLSDEYGTHWPTTSCTKIDREQLVKFAQYQINYAQPLVVPPQQQQQQHQPVVSYVSASSSTSSHDHSGMDEQQVADYRAFMQQRSKYKKR